VEKEKLLQKETGEQNDGLAGTEVGKRREWKRKKKTKNRPSRCHHCRMTISKAMKTQLIKGMTKKKEPNT